MTIWKLTIEIVDPTHHRDTEAQRKIGNNFVRGERLLAESVTDSALVGVSEARECSIEVAMSRQLSSAE